MADKGHKETDLVLLRMENLISLIYSMANRDIRKKIDEYFAKYKNKDEAKRKMLENGDITEEEYRKWRTGQLLVGSRWIAMARQIAKDYHSANVIARRIIEDNLPDVYAINMNYLTYTIEHELGVDTAFTLYNREAVEHILRENPKMLPKPGRALAARIAAGKDVLWNNQQIQSVMMQGIIQGESIPEIASRLETVTERNRNNALRNARTMTTYAENLGRVDAMKRVQNKGIQVMKTWVATLSYRTRHAHRILDGQTVPPDQPFDYEGIKLMCPGDQSLGAPGWMIYNCRCSTIPQIKGFEYDMSDMGFRNSKELYGTSYEQWKESKFVYSDKITKQDEIARIMKAKYMAEYKKAMKNERGD